MEIIQNIKWRKYYDEATRNQNQNIHSKEVKLGINMMIFSSKYFLIPCFDILALLLKKNYQGTNTNYHY